jgi:tripartite-type tricarboxylate transporter receptor subunit TctC
VIADNAAARATSSSSRIRGSVQCVVRSAVLACGCAFAAASAAQSYPVKPIRIIVTYPAGGGTDFVARLIAQRLTESFGRQVIVDNRPGANGNIGTDAIAKAAPDGYTIGMATPGPVTIGRSLYANLPYDPQRDLVPIILVNASPNVLAVHPSVTARSPKDLVALARRHPVQIGASTVASVQHLLAEMFNHAAGTRMQIITYKGGAQAATDVVGGQIDALWSVLPVVLPFIRSERLRPLAVASEQRSALLPEVATMKESGWPQVVALAWNGVVAPAGTPGAVVQRLNEEIARSLESPEMRKRFAAAGMEPLGGSPEQFDAFLREETGKWAQVIRSANVKVE